MIDLRHVNKEAAGLYAAALKRDAAAEAKRRGWPASAVLQAYNRFCVFWIIGQSFGGTAERPIWRMAAAAGGIVEIEAGFEPFKGKETA
jgi:hypothetical protein